MNIKEWSEKNYQIIYLIAMIGVGLWVAYIKGWIFANFQSISAKEAIKLIKENRYPIIDIRDNTSWNKGHIKGAIHIPLNNLENNISKIVPYKNSKILVYSQSGINSIKASRFLSKKGFQVINIKSGILGLAIEGAKYPNLFSK